MDQFFLAALVSGRASPWYDNGWIIGIATGLASGALLAAVTPLFLRKRRARDLAIRRDRAAEDVLSALRPSVATGYLPSASTVEAIARASAYRRGLDPKLAVPTLTIIDVLISEIMATAFLGPEVRLSEAKGLLALRAELDEPPGPNQSSSGGNYASEALGAATIGAVTIGGASAVSSVTGNWIPIVAIASAGALVFLVYYFTGYRRFRTFSFGPIEFSTIAASVSQANTTEAKAREEDETDARPSGT